MRIAIFTHNYPEDSLDRQNAGIFVHDLARELAKQGNGISVVCPGGKKILTEIEKISVYRFTWNEDKKLGQLKLWHPLDIIDFFLFFISGYYRSCEVSKKFKPDICLAMWAFPSGIFTYLLKMRLGIPYCIWALGSDIYIYAKLPIIGYFIRKVLQGAQYLFADGIDLAREVELISGKKCLFLPSASNFTPRKRNNLQNKKKIRLAFVGRMEAVKGPDVLINALIEMKNQIKKFEVHMLGDGSLLSVLKSRVTEMGIVNNVRFYGNVGDKQEIANILFKSDWLIIPSRSDSIPLVFSEAMKSNIPVIAADLLDLKYLVSKYKIGYTFKAGDMFSLVSIISSLDKKSKDWRIFQKNTGRVAELFSVKNSAERLVRILKVVLKSSSQ